MSVDIEHTEEELAALKAKREAERQHCAEVADEISSGLNDDGYPRLKPDHLGLLTKILVDQRSEAVIQGLFTIIDEFNACKSDRDAWKARAEAAEVEAKRCAEGWDVAGAELRGLQLRSESERSLRVQFTEDAEDLRAKLAAAEARVADGTWRVGRKVGRTLYRGDVLIGVMDTAEDASLVVTAIARAEKAEAAAGQMRAALDDALEALHEGDHAVLRKAMRAALATDVGRDYRSPEQVAHACAAARDAALAAATAHLRRQALFARERDFLADGVDLDRYADEIRALKVTP